jgi:hypothetical protein
LPVKTDEYFTKAVFTSIQLIYKQFRLEIVELQIGNGHGSGSENTNQIIKELQEQKGKQTAKMKRQNFRLNKYLDLVKTALGQKQLMNTQEKSLKLQMG